MPPACTGSATSALGDMAVWVGVSSRHRAEAFAACRYIIDEVKHRVPIWKKEHYVDGDSGWVNCERCAQPGSTTMPTRSCRHAHAGTGTHAHAARCTRTGLLAADRAAGSRAPTGQQRLARGSVLVIGAGGLGVPVLQYLAAAGVGRIGIVDGDVVEASNLHRQPLYGVADIGQPKAAVAAARLRAAEPRR